MMRGIGEILALVYQPKGAQLAESLPAGVAKTDTPLSVL
jgi:hypothetical protein